MLLEFVNSLLLEFVKLLLLSLLEFIKLLLLLDNGICIFCGVPPEFLCDETPGAFDSVRFRCNGDDIIRGFETELLRVRSCVGSNLFWLGKIVGKCFCVAECFVVRRLGGVGGSLRCEVDSNGGGDGDVDVAGLILTDDVKLLFVSAVKLLFVGGFIFIVVEADVAGNVGKGLVEDLCKVDLGRVVGDGGKGRAAVPLLHFSGHLKKSMYFEYDLFSASSCEWLALSSCL